jgi:hypothetical protein
MKRFRHGSAEWTWIKGCKFPREGVTVDNNGDFLIADTALQKLTLEGTEGAIVPRTWELPERTSLPDVPNDYFKLAVQNFERAERADSPVLRAKFRELAGDYRDKGLEMLDRRRQPTPR